MSALLILYTLWQGELVTPDDKRLEAGAKCDCVCIGCGEPLILRRGEKKRWHFAHRAETSCGGETYIHKVVKAWIAEKLIGQTIPLPPHPELNSPQGFCVEKGGQEKRSEETDRIYDVVLEGMFLYEKAEQEKRGRLIFEVYYSNAKDDDFKLQTQKEGSYILEVNAKEFYGDGRENFTVERLRENSQWVWFTDHQLEEQKREPIRKQNWIKYGYGKTSLCDMVRAWIDKEVRYVDLRGNLRNNGPFRGCGLLRYAEFNYYKEPVEFQIKKVFHNRRSERTRKVYDIVLEGIFIYQDPRVRVRGHLIFQLVDRFNAHDDDFKLQIRKAKFCVLEVDIHRFFGDGLKPPTAERLLENSRWVW